MPTTNEQKEYSKKIVFDKYLVINGDVIETYFPGAKEPNHWFDFKNEKLSVDEAVDKVINDPMYNILDIFESKEEYLETLSELKNGRKESK